MNAASLAAIDARNDNARRITAMMLAGGFSLDGVRHGAGKCGPACTVCANERRHAGCYGCPDC